MRTVLTFVLLLSCAPLGAHDFWIEPTTFRPAAGETIGVALRVGEGFAGDPVPRDPEKLASFVVRDASGERDVDGIPYEDPAGEVAIDKAGPAMIGYRSSGSSVELPREKFEKYLGEEGAEGLTVRDGIQRERFYRYAKSIIGTGVVNKPLGYRLELIPADDLSRFQLLLEGKPLPNALVVALSRDGKHLTARSDRAGRVVFALTEGVWLIKSTRIAPAPAGSAFDWESLWASLTFER